MRIILKVSSSNEYCDGGCEFALVDLTPELAGLAVGRIATLREQKSLDPDIDETYYWAYFAEYFSPWKDLASPGQEVEGTRMTLEDMLDELAIEEKEIVCVPETFQVPPRQIAAVECEQMIVRDRFHRVHGHPETCQLLCADRRDTTRHARSSSYQRFDHPRLTHQ